MSTTTQDRWDADVPLPKPRKNKVEPFHHVEMMVFRTLRAIFGHQPIERAGAQMAAVLKVVGPMVWFIHNRGHRNLQLIYPDMTAAERAAILRGAWENLGALVGEFFHMDELSERTTVRGADYLEDLVKEGRQAIFISGHFANWEAMAVTLARYGLKYGVVYRAANNPLIDKEIIGMRARSMSRWQIPKDKRGARPMFKALGQGHSLCMLMDQKLNDGIEVPFMGYPAMTPSSAARLSIRDGIPLVPLQLVRQPGSRFVMTVHEPLEIEDTGDIKADTEALMVKVNDALGSFVFERPDQWLWFHRRWPRRLTG